MQYYDLHTHTTHSDGQATVPMLLDVAAKKGYRLGISDHFFCGELDTFLEIETYLDDLEGYDVFKGCEANIGEDYSVPDNLAYRLDYVIASVHSAPDLKGGKLFLGDYFGERAGEDVKWAANFDRNRCEDYLASILPMVEHAMRTQRMDIYGHCTVLPFYEALEGDPFLLDWENEVIGLCKKYHVAMEISGLWKEPNLEMVLRAKDAGVSFSLGSDCHLLQDACNLDYAIDLLQKAQIPTEQIFQPQRDC